MDLGLVSIEDLLAEVAKRTQSFVVGYSRKVDQGEPIIYVDVNGEDHLTLLGLCEEIKEYIHSQRRDVNGNEDTGGN